ncbi:AI-2E family transporter [Membranicola marinus]|uniref:AI-2E family transporter n=1 Tax=Membranihabitans marinus TaxID=1227546 RepID=A0A953HPG4_9BACT|nr:AI-2E family transporter [Membranihabitans marinus]MBY5958403.1 AI-2E family transporter [Membranihabitans marinus]
MEAKSGTGKIAYSLITLVIIVWIMYLTQSILVPFLFAILLSMALYPVARIFERWGMPRVLTSILCVLIAIVVLGGVVWFVINQVIQIGRGDYNLGEKFNQIVTVIIQFMTEQFGLETTDLWNQLRESSMQVISNITSYLTVFFGSAGNTIANAVLIPLYMFFLLYYRIFFVEFFFRAFQKTPEVKIKATLERIYSVIHSYLFGLLTVMVIVALLNSGGLLVLGIENAWFFGTLAALLLLIPYIGIAIGSLLPALFALATKDSAYYALGVLVWFQIVQFFEGNFITPNIVGGKVNISPLIAIIALLLGGKLFGLAGLILAMPMVAVTKVLLDASDEWKAFGFLLGEPSDKHLDKGARKRLLKKIGIYSFPLKKGKDGG